MFPNDHSHQQQQQHLVLGFIQINGIPNFYFLCVIRIAKRKCGKLGRRQQLKTFTFGGIHGGSTTPENGVLSPLSLGRSLLNLPTDHRQFRSEDIRSQRYLTLITMAMVPGTIVTFCWRHYSNFELIVPS